jgi:8-oxo-dGTP pyrophosphatase MutT (NUDIX family)
VLTNDGPHELIRRVRDAEAGDHDGRARRDNGKWEIPGGILELPESIHDGLRREVEEETGALIETDRLTGVYKNLKLGVVALVFRARIVGGQLGPTEESARIDWWTRDTVAKQMAETFAVRVFDALDVEQPAIRVHDGVHVLAEQSPAR